MMNGRQPVGTASTYYHHSHAHHAAYAAQAIHGHYHDTALTTAGYRPALHVSLQQPQPPQHHSAEQLSLAASGFHAQNFRARQHYPQQHLQTLPVRTRAQTRQQQIMAQEPSPEEYAEFQKLSNEYQPEVTGPFVGQREPSTKITTDYALADPVYQTKTAALPQKYSHYRTVRGDGRCGWRAIAFGYYEALIRVGDSNKFLQEEARLRSLGNVLTTAGYDSFLWEDMAEEAYDLLRKITNALPAGSAEEVLHETFNDESTQNCIISWLRTLTAAWMKTRQGEYAPWLPGQTVDEYCEVAVLPMGSEIENVSLAALKDVFLSPAGVTLEVVYLDRSQGDEPNMHRWDPAHIPSIGFVRLLYRPGHYDILYELEDVPSIPTFLQFASQQAHDFEPVGGVGMDFMLPIPGMSYASPHQHWMSTSSHGDSDFFAMSAPVQQCAAPVSTPAPAPAPTPLTMAQPHAQPQPMYVHATPTQLVAPPLEMPQELAIRTVPSQAPAQAPIFQHQFAGPFRPSVWQLEDGFGQAGHHQLPLQTSIFRNSHFNTAHFLNPDFQPEEWRPDAEPETTSSRGSRHRNSG